jgi:hypothetical protein
VLFRSHSQVSTRLADGRDRFEEAMDLMYRCLAEAACGRDYTPLLEAERGAGGRARGGEKIALPAFVTTGSLFVWTGERPGILRRLLRRGRLRPNAATAAHIAWAAWADLSPKSLRAFLRAWLKLRNRKAERHLAGRAFVEWKPPGGPQ